MHLQFVGTGLIVVALAAAPASAQSRGDRPIETPEIIEELFDCRAIEEPEARLACFDREVAEVFEAQNSRQLVIADREQVRETRKGLFGFTLPKLGIFGGGDDDDDEEEITEITSTITSIRRMGNGRYFIAIETGARWMQSDSTPVLGNPEAGDAITIKRAAMGSYMAKIEGRRAIRVKRVD
jgi:hypothetical protein